jgi:hypothetical protein
MGRGRYGGEIHLVRVQALALSSLRKRRRRHHQSRSTPEGPVRDVRHIVERSREFNRWRLAR